MKVLSHELCHLKASRELTFAAVQLARGDMAYDEQTRSYAWESRSRARRIEDIQNIMKAVGTIRPDVLVFPEYSYPKDLLSVVDFQRAANEMSCIIIAGSYFDNEASSATFRNNIAPIYIPGADGPLRIGKFQSSPEERGRLDPATSMPNIARLVWPQAAPNGASFSVFICRDYLSPFAARPGAEPPIESGSEVERVSLLDWDREGINIVVMENRDPTMFESAAAFDVRQTHGERKLVLFVNSTSGAPRLSTALLGASDDPAREADIAARLPPAAEGVLVFQARLWDVAGRREVPDVTTSFPVSAWTPYVFNPEKTAIKAAAKVVSPPKRRAIFHPALLTQLQKNLVIDFYVAKYIPKVNQAFEKEEIKHVAASYVRGIEDVVIRRYEDVTSCVGKVELDVPFIVAEKGLDDLFDTKNGNLQLQIVPNDILKFRGVKVPRNEEDPWREIQDKITSLISRRGYTERIIDLARDMKNIDSVPKDIAAAFLSEIEEYQPVGGDHFGNNLRETYILVSAQHEKGTGAEDVFLVYIDERLMGNAHVREICRITRIEPRQRASFSFLLRLKCTVFEADRFIYDMLDWAARRPIRIGLRSYDLWNTLQAQSIAGILDSSMSSEERRLLRHLRGCKQARLFGRDRLQRIANVVRDQRAILQPCDLVMEQDLTNFYAAICLHHLEEGADLKSQHLTRSSDAYFHLFKQVEGRCRRLLVDALGLSESCRPNDIYEAAKAKVGSLENMPETERKDPVRIVSRGWSEIIGDASAKEFMQSVRASYAKITPFRNSLIHGGYEAAWAERIDLGAPDWATRVDKIEEPLRETCKLIRALCDEDQRQAVKP